MFRLLLVTALVATAFAAPSTHLKAAAPRLNGRIIGGEDVSIEDYNYQISLLYYNSHICGGSVISPQYAITAAHCTYGGSVSSYQIRAGSSIRNSGGVVVAVEAIFQNPQYDDWTLDYDITVLLLASELTYSAAIGPIGLPVLNQQIPAGTRSVVSGWGTTSSGSSATQLQAVDVPIVSLEDCKAAYDRYDVTERMICAGYLGEGGKDACQGDSGGPLVVDGILIGTVSWGIGCAQPDYPGVYGSVASLRGYVAEVTGL